jgi:hypothetical protein
MRKLAVVDTHFQRLGGARLARLVVTLDGTGQTVAANLAHVRFINVVHDDTRLALQFGIESLSLGLSRWCGHDTVVKRNKIERRAMDDQRPTIQKICRRVSCTTIELPPRRGTQVTLSD